jgi:6-phosphogluconate dehydrogenase
MQRICEAYQLMRDYLGMTADEMHTVFADWNASELDSYLIEITRDILGYKDTDGEPLVDRILDTAGQKGTGKWTGIAALDEGVALTSSAKRWFSRCLSAIKEERVAASKVLSGPTPRSTAIAMRLLRTLRTRCTPLKLCRTRKGTPLCARRQRPTVGTSTTAASR